MVWSGGVCRCDPVVAIGVRLLPFQPDASGLVGKKLGFLEAVGPCEAKSTFADEQDVIRALHHGSGDARGCLYVAQCGDGAGACTWAVHDAGVEFDDAVFVRQTAVTDGMIVGILFDDVDAGDGSVERVGALAHQVDSLLRGWESVSAGDRQRSLRPAGGFAVAE